MARERGQALGTHVAPVAERLSPHGLATQAHVSLNPDGLRRGNRLAKALGQADAAFSRTGLGLKDMRPAPRSIFLGHPQRVDRHAPSLLCGEAPFRRMEGSQAQA